MINTLPTISDILTGITSYADGIFGSYLPLILMSSGILLGVMIISWLISVFSNSFDKLNYYNSLHSQSDIVSSNYEKSISNLHKYYKERRNKTGLIE